MYQNNGYKSEMGQWGLMMDWSNAEAQRPMSSRIRDAGGEHGSYMIREDFILARRPPVPGLLDLA